MCGRYSLSTKSKIIQEEFSIEVPFQLEISFNIAPTQLAYVITNQKPNVIQQMQWGLIPSWSSSTKLSGQMINARSESIFEKPSFKEAILQRRCLIPADSFYEWKKEGNSKKPYRILPIDGSLMCFAGIWETWKDDNNEIQTFSIITCPANVDVDTLHNRMPVILYQNDRQRWLQNIDVQEIQDLMKTPLPGKLKMYRITAKANSPGFNQASIHQEVKENPTLF